MARQRGDSALEQFAKRFNLLANAVSDRLCFEGLTGRR
jgi:hypothetical protein